MDQAQQKTSNTPHVRSSQSGAGYQKQMTKEERRESNDKALEMLLLFFLGALTLGQFGWWGYEFVISILGAMFNVDVPDASFLTSIVGLIAIIGSVLILVGIGFWYVEKWFKAGSWIRNGILFFVAKNVFDIVDSMLLFGQNVVEPDLGDIQDLAWEIGAQGFQLLFWVLAGLYLLYRANKRLRAAE